MKVPLEKEKKNNQDCYARRLAVSKRLGIFADNVCDATFEIAKSPEDLIEAYRLVFYEFNQKGFLPATQADLRVRIYEAMSKTTTFIAKVKGEIVGVIGIIGDSEMGLPSDAAFKDELDKMRYKGLRLCEWTNQAVLKEYRNSAIAVKLMCCAFAHLVSKGYDNSIATISLGHQSFYEMIGFNKCGSERNYSKEIYDPVIAMSLDTKWYTMTAKKENGTEQFLRDYFFRKNPFISCIQQMTQDAECNPHDTLMLKKLFIMNCSDEELDFLEKCLGHELFVGLVEPLIFSSNFILANMFGKSNQA